VSAPQPRASRAAALVAVFALGLGAPRAADAQTRISGQIDLVGTVNRDSVQINTALRGDSPYNPVRMRLFLQSWLNERIGVFGELLLDIDSDPRLNGAYVVVNELASQPWLNARMGLSPSIVGGFGLRSTYFNANPLIGVPLLWQYRTSLASDGSSTPLGLIGSAGDAPGAGTPLLYDTCWNIQWELLGELGRFEYSIGLTPGSLSNPIKSRSVGGSQWLGRVGVAPLTGLRVGVSGAHGPWLTDPLPDGTGQLPYSDDPGAFDQSALGIDFEYLRGPLALYSEWFALRFETPLVAEDLDALGGFVEARVDVAPGWYVAGRYGGLFFSDVTVAATAAPWSPEVRRSELAVGYRVSREMLLKLDWQRTSQSAAQFTQNLFAAQLSAVF
jgi:hypothetical protein